LSLSSRKYTLAVVAFPQMAVPVHCPAVGLSKQNGLAGGCGAAAAAATAIAWEYVESVPGVPSGVHGDEYV